MNTDSKREIDSAIECTFDSANELVKVKWHYEHPMSFVSRNRIECIFNGRKPYEHYFGIGISYSNLNVSLSPLQRDSLSGRDNHSFGVGFPNIELPPDPELLRELSNIFQKIATSLEKNA